MAVVGAVFFDVDGTLVRGTSSSQHLAGYLGHAEALRRLDEAFLAGTVHNSEIAALDARAYAGTAPDELVPWLDNLPLVDGIVDAVGWCKDRRLLPVLTTLAWEPVGAYLCARFGFAAACGPRLAVADGRYTGEVGEHLTPEGRRDFALDVCGQHGLDPKRAVAVGDSRSDLPLFAEVGLAVAFNAADVAKAAADLAVDSDDLRALIDPLDDWFA